MACQFIYKDRTYTRTQMLRAIATGEVSRPDATLAARKWLQSTLGLNDDQIVEIKGLIENKSIGRVLDDGRILLSNLGDMGTAYEEAFHRVFRFSSTPEERAALLEEVKARPYTSAEMLKLKQDYPDLSDDELMEEILAKDFVLYAQSEGAMTLPKVHTTVFDRIISFFKALMGLDTKKVTISEVYGAILTGKYKNKTVNTYAEGYADSRVSGIPLIYKHEIVQNIATRIFERIVHEQEINIHLNKQLDINLAILDAVGGLIDNELIDNEDLQLAIAEDLLNDEGKIRQESVLFKAVQSNLANIGFTVKGIVAETTRTLEDLDDPDAENDEVVLKDQAFDKVSFEFDPRNGIKPGVAILLNSLFDDSNLSPKLKILKPLNYTEITGVLFHILNGVPSDFDLVMVELEKNKSKYSWLQQLIDAVGVIDNPASTPLSQLKLANEFVSSFTKNKYSFLKGILKKGSIRFINLGSDDQSRKYATIWKGRVDLNTPDVASLIYRLKSASTTMQIAEALGFDEIDPGMLSLPLEDTGVETVGSKLANIRNVVVEGLEAGVEVSKVYNRQPTALAKYEVRGSVLQIAKVVSMYGKPLDLMLLNTDRKRIYSVTLHNYQTMVIGRLNWIARSEGSVEDRLELLQKHVSHLHNSVLISKSGEIRSEWLKNIMNGIELNFDVFDGAQSRKRIKSASKLKAADMLMFHVNAIQQGRIFSFKHGDRSTLFMYKFANQTSVASRGLISSMNAHVEKSLDYLDAELHRILQHSKSDVTSRVVNWVKRGNKVTFFPFLSQSAVDKLIKKGTWNKASLRKLFAEDIREFFELETAKTLKSFNSSKLASLQQKSKIPIGIDADVWAKYSENNKTTVDALNEIMLNATALQMFGYMEQAMLFTGDPANYKNSVDFFKRIKMQSSTGIGMNTGRVNDEYINAVNTRDSFNLVDDPTDYTYGPLKVTGQQSELVLQLNPTNSTSREWMSGVFENGIVQDYRAMGFSEEEANTLSKAYSDAANVAYEGYDENDGMSYINIFFWREYEHRQGAWTEEKENTFQLELAVLKSRNPKNTIVWVDPSDRITVSAKERPGYIQVNPFDVNSVKDNLQLGWNQWFSRIFDYAAMKKPQYTGPLVTQSPGSSAIIAGRKTAYGVLMPSVIHGTNLAKLNAMMLRTGIDSVHMESAAKYGRFNEGSKAPKEAHSLYSEDGSFNEMIETHAPDMVSYLDLAYQKDQLAIPNKPKREIKNATQSSKIIFSNLFSAGTPKDYTSAKPFAELRHSEKLAASPIFETYEKYQKSLAALINLKKDELELELGENKVARLGEILKKNAESKQEAQYILDSIDLFVKEEGLELLPNWGRVENLLYSIVTNDVLSVNRPGDGKAQFAVTMWEDGARTSETSGYQSSNALKFYSVEKDANGNVTKVNPSECIIPLPPKMFNSLLARSGKSNLLDAINWYNKLPDDEKIVMKGVRIPNQQLSFNEVLRVARFTSPTLQSFIVLPSEIVVKSGSDFDIDTQKLYMPVMDKEGKVVSYRFEGDDYEASLYNDLLAAEIQLLLHPRNAHNLLAPSTDAWLSKDIFSDIVSLREGITKAQAIERQDEFVLKVGTNDLFSLVSNVESSVKFMESKSNVGLVATAITAHSIGQVDNAGVSDKVIVVDPEDPKKNKELSSNLMFDSTENNNLSGIFDSKGNVIMDRFSGLLTSQIDAMANNYAASIQLTDQTIPMIAYLARRGVSAEVAIKLMNVPLVKAYLDFQNQNNSLAMFSDYNIRVKNASVNNALMISELKVGDAQLKTHLKAYAEGTGEKITEDELNAAIKDNRSTSSQVKMLAAVIHLSEYDKLYRKYMVDLTADTKPKTNRDDVIAYEKNFEELQESNLIKDMTHRQGFLKPFYDVQNMYRELFEDLYVIPEEVLEIVTEPLLANKTDDEIAKIRVKASNDFILFMLQNYNQDFVEKYNFNKLFVGKDSVARQMLRAKGDDNLMHVVDSLLPMLNEVVDHVSGAKADVLKIAERGASVQQMNDLYEAFSMLSDVQQEKLLFLSLHQSGLSRSPFSLDVMINAGKMSSVVQSIKEAVTNLLGQNPEETIESFQKLFYFNNPHFLPFSMRDAENGPGYVGYIDDESSEYLVEDTAGNVFHALGNQYFLRYNLDTPIAANIVNPLLKALRDEEGSWPTHDSYDRTSRTLNKSSGIEIVNGKWSRSSVTNDPKSMYIFTDNADRSSAPNATTENVDKNSWYYKKYKSTTSMPIHYGSTSNPTSAVIRGLNNAYPISTVKSYGTNWKESEFDEFKRVIDDEIAQIKNDLANFQKLKIGNFRIGQGGRIAKVPTKLQSYLDSKLLELGVNNSGQFPKIQSKLAESGSEFLTSVPAWLNAADAVDVTNAMKKGLIDNKKC